MYTKQFKRPIDGLLLKKNHCPLLEYITHNYVHKMSPAFKRSAFCPKLTQGLFYHSIWPFPGLILVNFRPVNPVSAHMVTLTSSSLFTGPWLPSPSLTAEPLCALLPPPLPPLLLLLPLLPLLEVMCRGWYFDPTSSSS